MDAQGHIHMYMHIYVYVQLKWRLQHSFSTWFMDSLYEEGRPLWCEVLFPSIGQTCTQENTNSSVYKQKNTILNSAAQEPNQCIYQPENKNIYFCFFFLFLN